VTDKEGFFISLFQNQHIGDDGAVVGKYVYSKDLFCEDIHFKQKWMSLQQIAYKSMLINISDAVVMNAHPKYALIGIKIPSNFTTSQMQELSDGFLQASKEFDFQIIGGDTVSGDKLDISITIISTTQNPIYRTGIKEGNLLAFTGEIGTVKKDLDALFQNKQIKPSSKFIKPILKKQFFYNASEYINSALDISDGLSKDLSRLSLANNMGFKFLHPLSKDELCSGEEYEILFAFEEKNLKIIQKIANQTDTKLTIFAKAIKGKYTSICKENHF
jgi:thiamine-monophosphate kinase